MATTAYHDQSTEASPLLAGRESEVSSHTLGDASDGEESFDPDKANQSVGRLRVIFIVLSLWILIFLQAGNMSGITTIQSIIADDLDSFAQASWFTSSYLIATSSVAPLAGRLSQLFSPRLCILVSAVIFSMGGLITSQARSFSGFIAGRAISGIGSAGILTISMILVLELSGRKRRGFFIGLINAGYTSGIAMGAVVAGGLVEHVGWKALFWMQTPLALLAGLGIFFSIPKSFISGPQGSTQTLSQKVAKIDYFGATALSCTIVLFLYGMASSKIQWIPIGISACLLPIFVLNEIYWAHVPIIPVTVLKSRGVFLTCVAQMGFMMARWTVLIYTPVYAMAVRGWSPASAGSVLVPTNIGFALGGLLVGGLHIKRGGSFYLPCIITLLLFVVTLSLFSQRLTANTSAILFITICFLNGLFTGAVLNYTLSHLLFRSLPADHFIVTGLLSTFRGFAGSFGTAIGSGIFLRTLKKSLETEFNDRDMRGEEDLVRRLLGSPALVGTLAGAEKEVAVQGYVTALQTLFMTASGLAFLTVIVQAGTGWKMPSDDVEVDTLGEQEE